MSLAEPLASRFDFDPHPEAMLERITVGQLELMIDAGVFPEDARLELIDGLIVRNDSNRGEGVIKQRHFYSTSKLSRWARAFDETMLILQVQLPIALTPSNEPFPDGAIVRGPLERYQLRKPEPSDIAVVIEVANATLRFDRTTKLRTYALAGVPQYVIVNLVDDVIEVRGGPDPVAGTYGEPTLVARDGTVTFQLFDGQTLDVPAADLLP